MVVTSLRARAGGDSRADNPCCSVLRHPTTQLGGQLGFETALSRQHCLPHLGVSPNTLPKAQPQLAAVSQGSQSLPALQTFLQTLKGWQAVGRKQLASACFMLRSPSLLPVQEAKLSLQCGLAQVPSSPAQAATNQESLYSTYSPGPGQAQVIADLVLLWNPFQEVPEIITPSRQLQITPEHHPISSKTGICKGQSGQVLEPHWGKSHSLKSAPCMEAHLLWWYRPHRQTA